MSTQPLRYEHYEIQADENGSPLRLGAGGMGATYRAIDTRLKRVVALKIISNRLLADANSKRRFLNEARAAARIDHPNVARVFHVSPENAAECFFAMELVEGETLSSRVTRYGPMPPGEALLTLRPIAEALGALAEHSLVHRDLKPDNIMLVRTGRGGARVKLIDFGLAKSLNDPSAHFQSVNTGERFVGSVYFASPEQIRPRAGMSLDARSDFYSLGATLWSVLSGFPPFTGTVFEVQEGHVYHDPPWEKIAPLHPPLRILLTRLLAKDPAERPADAAALLAEWDAAIEDMRAYPAQTALVPEPVVMEEEATVLHEVENKKSQPDPADIVEPEPEPLDMASPVPSPALPLPKKKRSRSVAVIALLLLATAAFAGWWFTIKQPRLRGDAEKRRMALIQIEREHEEEATRRAEAEAATARAEKQLAAQQEAEKKRNADAAKKQEEIDRIKQVNVAPNPSSSKLIEDSQIPPKMAAQLAAMRASLAESAKTAQVPAEKLIFVNEDGLKYRLTIELLISGNNVAGSFSREPLDAGKGGLTSNAALSESAEFTGTAKGGRTFIIKFKDETVPYDKPDGEIEWRMVSRSDGRVLLVPYMTKLQDGSRRYEQVTIDFLEIIKRER